MTPDLRTLAVAIIALPGWEWRAGMRAIFPSGQGVHIQAGGNLPHGGAPVMCLPDITDMPTAGAMLGLLPLAKDCVDVRQSNVGINIESGPLYWLSHYWSQGRVLHTGRGATFGEAIARLAVKRGGWV